jgi:hypothetical protein
MPYLYLILFIWSITSLLYALIKRNETALETFAILVPLLYITISNILSNSYSIVYLPFLWKIYAR